VYLVNGEIMGITPTKKAIIPTKKAIIGSFINGRNDLDDFLHLKTNNGGQIFAWIDSNGNLQGALTALPNGATATTQPSSDNSTLIATDAFVQNSVQSSGFAVTSATISPLSPVYGGKWDARAILCDLSAGGSTVKSSALFLASDVGKVIFCLQNGGSVDALALTTVTGFTSTSQITVAGTIALVTTPVACYIGSQNERTALNLASAAIPALGGSLKLPCGHAIISGGQILSNFPTAGSPPIEVGGCGPGVSNFYVDWGSIPPNTTLISGINNQNMYWHDFSVENSVNGIAAQFNYGNSTVESFVSLSGYRMERITVGDIYGNAVNGTNACINSANDGTRLAFIKTHNCAVGIDLWWKNVACIDCVGQGDVGIRTFDTGVWIIGGSFLSTSSSGAAIYVQQQGAPGDIYIQGAIAYAAPGGPAVRVGAGLNNVVIENSLLGGESTGVGLQANATALSIGSGARVTLRDTNMVSSGSGVNINNSGTLLDAGGNQFFLTGAANYVGAGTFMPDGHGLTGACTGVATASQTLGLYGTGPNVTDTTCTSTTIGAGVPMSGPRTLANLVVTAGTGGKTSSSGVFTVLKNGSPTTITCTTGTATSCVDGVHAVSAVAGDLISIEFTTQASETLAGVQATVAWY